MTKTEAQYGFIGIGAIAAAMVNGLCRRDEAAPSILLSPRNAQRAAQLTAQHPSVTLAADNQAVIDGSRVVVLCLRPQDAPAIIPGLSFSPDQAVISVMAGVSLRALAGLGVPATNIARSIPLPAVANGKAATPIYPATDASRKLFERLGTAEAVPDEKAFEALSAATATIATHFAYLAAIADWLRQKRVPETIVRHQLAATFAGVAAELDGKSPDFEHLADDYATAGGINAQFLASMNAAGLIDHVSVALEEVLERLTRDAL